MPIDNNSNFFTHIYTTHALHTIQDYIARDKKARIRRAKIETDIIRLTHEDPDLPIAHKVVCSSMIMHTNTFEPFWSEQQRAYELSDKALRRLEPEYSLMDEIVCPEDASVSVENLPTTNDSRDEAKPSAKKPARGKKPTNDNKETKPRQPLSHKKNAQPIATKAPRKRAPKATKAQAVKTPKKTPPAAKTARKPASKAAKPTGVVKNVSPKKVTPPPVSVLESPRPLSAREAYEQCMARSRDEPRLRGPSSGEDDDSESESESEEE